MDSGIFVGGWGGGVGGGGGSCPSVKKADNVVVVFLFFLDLNLVYRSPMVDFKENYIVPRLI